ncbi:MAG TPA: hypothetical protein VFH46_09010 [Pyrinomonadaceae bacterium]|nr:hypothetical protein [Pyrinomonadaceae bacterium]
MVWRPDRLLKAILIWTMITMIIVWLPLIRGLMDGDSYEWGNSFWGIQVGGQGVHGQYWLLLLQAIIGIAVLYFGWRGARQPFHWLLLLWHIPLGAQAIYDAISSPEDYRFRGDTLGVDVSLAWVGPLFFGGFALLSVLWVIRDFRRERDTAAPEWKRANYVLLLIAVSLLPIQFLLLRFGEQHGPGDQAGVILTMGQWVLINLGLFPWLRSKVSETAHA